MSELTHFDEQGNSRMVDVGLKPSTHRIAMASGRVEMKPETLRRILNREFEKGEVLEVARLAGIMATKRTADLIPLCHPIAINSVDIEMEPCGDHALSIRATVKAFDRTGVEMEALQAVSTAALTIYDMCKSVDRGMTIRDIQLEQKSGGKSGDFDRRANNDQKETRS